MRLVLAVAGSRLAVAGSRLVIGRRLVLVVADSRLVVVGWLLLPGLLGLVVRYRPPGNRPGNQRPPPCPSPESHGEPLPCPSEDTSRYARPWPIDLRSPSGPSPPRNGADCIPRKGLKTGESSL